MPKLRLQPFSERRLAARLCTLRAAAGEWLGSRLPADSLRRRFASGTSWYAAGTLAYHGSKVLALIVVAQLLGRERFGELGALQSTILMFALFAGLGVGLTATKHVAEYRKSDPARAGRIIGLSFLVALVSGAVFSMALLLAAPAIAGRLLNAPHLTAQFRIASGLVFLHAVIGAQTGAMAGLEAFRSVARANLLHGSCALLVIVAGGWVAGLSGAVAALVGAAALGTVINQWILSRRLRETGLRIEYRPSGAEWNLLFRFSLPALLRGAMNAPVNWMVAAILVNQPNGFAEMGIFSAANQWRVLILMVPSLLERISLPILTSLQGNLIRYRKAFWLQVSASLGAAAGLAVPVSAAAPLVMRFYGESFSGGWPAIVLLAVGAVLASANNAVATALISSGGVWQSLWFELLWAMSLVFLAVLVAPGHGAIGLAACYPLASLAHSLILVAFWKRFRWNQREGSPEVRRSGPEILASGMAARAATERAM